MSDKDIVDNEPTKVGSQVSAVLFACNINAVRSAMAEAMVKHAFPGKIFVDSLSPMSLSLIWLYPSLGLQYTD